MQIPKYPLLKPLELSDKAMVESCFAKNPSGLSEYTFANFFAWRRFDRSELTMINGNLCFLVTAPDRNRYFMMPFGSTDMEDTLIKCLETAPKVVRLPLAFVEQYTKDSSRFAVEEDPDQFDYIYLSGDLAELKGKKYDGKRNHINYFLRSNSYTYARMSEKHFEECCLLNDAWCKEKKRESELFPNIECEAEVVKETLRNFRALGLTGGVIFVDGRIKAFSIGEKLTEDTAVIHIEKADPAIRGLSQLINREFVRNEWSHFRYINREQDMGHPGLRKAKLSYHPVKLEKKYNIMLK